MLLVTVAQAYRSSRRRRPASQSPLSRNVRFLALGQRAQVRRYLRGGIGGFRRSPRALAAMGRVRSAPRGFLRQGRYPTLSGGLRQRAETTVDRNKIGRAHV